MQIPSVQLHPDELPGTLTDYNQGAVARSTTPFGVAEAAYQKVLLAYRESQNLVALTLLHSALNAYPGHLPARRLLIDIEELDGRKGDAMMLLAQGLEIAPDYIPFKKRMARLLATRVTCRLPSRSS